VQELLVSLAEAVAIVTPGWAGDRRVAVTRVMGKVWRLPNLDIVASSLETIVDALVVNLNSWRRWRVDWVRMGAANGDECSGREQKYSEDFLHKTLLDGRTPYRGIDSEGRKSCADKCGHFTAL
jgi:hypothetical protein